MIWRQLGSQRVFKDGASPPQMAIAPHSNPIGHYSIVVLLSPHSKKSALLLTPHSKKSALL